MRNHSGHAKIVNSIPTEELSARGSNFLGKLTKEATKKCIVLLKIPRHNNYKM